MMRSVYALRDWMNLTDINAVDDACGYGGIESRERVRLAPETPLGITRYARCKLLHPGPASGNQSSQL